MTENKAEANENQGSEPIPLDAGHLCNLCRRRSKTRVVTLSGDLPVKWHLCGSSSVDKMDIDDTGNVSRCDGFLCQQASSPWANLGCELAPCACLGRAAA